MFEAQAPTPRSRTPSQAPTLPNLLIEQTSNAPIDSPSPTVALVGWCYAFASAGWAAIVYGVLTIAAGAVVFLIWAARSGEWPFVPWQLPESDSHIT